MVIMNEEKESPGNAKDSPKKMCPRAARENAKKKSETKSWKTAHTGLRFHFDRKKLVTHTFSSVSKTEKVTRSRSGEKTVEKQITDESAKSTGTKEIKVLMDTLKISKSEECSTREKSPLRKEMPKSPVVERLTSKKVCTRCSRCSKTPKEEKSETKPSKDAKNQDETPNTVKKENPCAKTFKLTPKAPESPKLVTCKKQCSKLAKLKVEPQEKTVKPKSILIHSEKSTPRGNEKNDVKTSDSPQSPKSMTCKKQCSKLVRLLTEPQEKNLNAKTNNVHTEKSDTRDNEKVSKNCDKTLADEEESNGPSEEKPVFAWPKSEIITSEIIDHEILEVPNESEHPATLDTRACLLNGTSHDEHLCDPHLGLDSPDSTRKELESMRTASKIPRKTHGAAGLKSDANLNKDMISQPLIEI